MMMTMMMMNTPKMKSPQKKYCEKIKEKLSKQAQKRCHEESDKEKAKQHYEDNKPKLQKIA